MKMRSLPLVQVRKGRSILENFSDPLFENDSLYNPFRQATVRRPTNGRIYVSDQSF